MNEQKLKALIRELMEPVLDDITELIYNMYSKVTVNMPAGMLEEQQVEMLKPLLESQAKAISASFKTLDINKLKEQMNGRKS